VVRALLYLADGPAPRLAAAPVGGRTLAVRAMVAGHRAGASALAMPLYRTACVVRIRRP